MTNFSHNPSTIERIVMRRVRTIRMLNAAFSLTTLSAAAGVLALWGIGREVWVAKVFANGPQDTLGHAFYLVYAFLHTQFLVQALTLVALVSVVYIARAMARVISETFVPARA